MFSVSHRLRSTKHHSFFRQCTANHCSTHQKLSWGWGRTKKYLPGTNIAMFTLQSNAVPPNTNRNTYIYNCMYFKIVLQIYFVKKNLGIPDLYSLLEKCHMLDPNNWFNSLLLSIKTWLIKHKYFSYSSFYYFVGGCVLKENV